ncbi:MAG: glutamate-1-semialdehyde 2,1-aminomutase [Paludibacteraceae bacterium]|nr:glutamate-1-semialdehyde 2,1-aminomutase [Paludibacteraceae bacterium]
MHARRYSIEAFEKAQQIIPGGVNSPVRALKSIGTTPLFVDRSDGARIYDIDGNSYIDLCMSWGVFMLGHNRDEVNRSVIAAVEKGSSYGIPTLSETELAEMVRAAFPSMQRLRFVNSGTEATMSAIRVARGFTGRDLLVKFEGCYHGHADHLLVCAGSAVANISTASSAGVPLDFTKHTVCLPYNDLEALERFFRAEGEHVAALIIEPVACNMGVVVPDSDFLSAIRRLTSEYGALLIFDEVITGFRLSYGGAQQRFGIEPDLTTVGKIVGGGYPAAAFGGREDIMSVLAPVGPVYQAGTLSGNPVAMAAGIATLRQLAVSGFYERLEARCDAFFSRLEQIVAGHEVQLNRCGSMYTLFFNPQPVRNFADAQNSSKKRFACYFQRMLERGVYVSPSQFEGNFISACHDDDMLEYVLRAVSESIE